MRGTEDVDEQLHASVCVCVGGGGQEAKQGEATRLPTKKASAKIMSGVMMTTWQSTSIPVGPGGVGEGREAT